jgi:hypothetical protein
MISRLKEEFREHQEAWRVNNHAQAAEIDRLRKAVADKREWTSQIYGDIASMAREANEYADEKQRLNSRQFTDSSPNLCSLARGHRQFGASWQELRDTHFARLIRRQIHEGQKRARKEKRDCLAKEKAARGGV